jgi:uncharacterized protein (TIGR03435 family)
LVLALAVGLAALAFPSPPVAAAGTVGGGSQAWALVAVSTLALPSDAAAQSTRPSFQVVSVKPADNPTAISIEPRRSGNRFTYVTEIRMVLYYAYRVLPFQVSGDLPDGVYDIETLADGSPAGDEARLMFQHVLEDRFGLRLHYETRRMRGYDLVVAKMGPKLKVAQNGGGQLLDGTLAPEGAGAYMSRQGSRLVGRNATMAQLADCLARNFRRPVADRTGIVGAFDFSIAFARDTLDKPSAETPDLSWAPSLQSAIQELGLRLQPAAADVRILVIDHVTPPTGN